MIEWFYLQIIAGKVNASPKIKGRNNPTIIIGAHTGISSKWDDDFTSHD